MQQRDYLKNEIEQMVKVIAKLITNITGINAPHQVSLTIDTSNEQLKTALNIDVEQLAQLAMKS